MLHLTSGPALMAEIGLALFCCVDALVAPEAAVRWLPRWAWVLLLLAFPLCGTIGWITAGRPWRAKARGQGSEQSAPGSSNGRPTAAADLPAAPAGPVDGTHATEATLVAELLAVHEEHERTLQLWEADLRRREAALRVARSGSQNHT